jgi:hypothetical protein
LSRAVTSSLTGNRRVVAAALDVRSSAGVSEPARMHDTDRATRGASAPVARPRREAARPGPPIPFLRSVPPARAPAVNRHPRTGRALLSAGIAQVGILAPPPMPRTRLATPALQPAWPEGRSRAGDDVCGGAGRREPGGRSHSSHRSKRYRGLTRLSTGQFDIGRPQALDRAARYAA